eukprot:scaffold2872_cov98-Skeletonema_dohrnii-CCMP3373.AAC.5
MAADSGQDPLAVSWLLQPTTWLAPTPEDKKSRTSKDNGDTAGTVCKMVDTIMMEWFDLYKYVPVEYYLLTNIQHALHRRPNTLHP